MPNVYRPVSECPEPVKFSGKDLRRFWSRIDKDGPVVRPELGKCWDWTGQITKGYGRIWMGGNNRIAHRISWIIVNGGIPDGLWALHHCDRRSCCNPSHLFLGTNQDNIADMISKGRHAHGARMSAIMREVTARPGYVNWAKKHPEKMVRGDAHWTRTHPEKRANGERQWCAKLKAAQVREIRAMRTSGASVSSIAIRFGISNASTWDVIKRVTWKHVA